MKRLVIVVVLIAAGVAAFGLYRGWFQVGSDSASDKANVTLSVDKSKIEADKDKAVDKVQDLGNKAK
jgi:hypothetical protein